MQYVCHGGPLSKFGEMYKAYINAREGAEVLEFIDGFVVLKTMDDMLYIETVYVAPDARKSGLGRRMLAHVETRAAKEGKKAVLGSCSPAGKGSTVSLKSMLACGFELLSCEKDMIYLIKPLAKDI